MYGLIPIIFHTLQQTRSAAKMNVVGKVETSYSPEDIKLLSSIDDALDRKAAETAKISNKNK